MVAWKPEVHFTKSAKSRMPNSKSPYKQQTFSSTTLLKNYPHIYGTSSGSRLAGTFSVKLLGIFSVYLHDSYGTLP